MTKFIHRFAAAVACCTLFLIFVGGLVKTTDSGLAVPDWPLSYGRLMPPMIGGIFYEHGHRMVASFVGFLMVCLAVMLAFKEERPWVRKMGWVGVGLVIFQGVLGGMTVLFRLPAPISIAHACTAQAFFCLTVSLAVWTSPFWKTAELRRDEPKDTIPLHRVGMTLVAATYIQLILGATLRHTGHALSFHISGAFIVAIVALWFSRRVWRDHRDVAALRRLAAGLVFILVSQILLGVTTYFLLIHRFETIPPPFSALATITAHVAIGALLLGLSLIATLVAYRTRPLHSSALRTTLQDYFTLTKPGISFMAGITALAGFVLGSRGDLNYLRLFHTCVGTLLAASGAGCLNMLIEKDVDAQMRRTQTRPLPSGRLQPGEVLLLGVFCSVAGVLYLGWAVNFLTAFFAALTLSVYLYIYTPLKKISGLCVTVGAVAGALPPVMGWTAATGQFTIEAVALFGILFFWQFPHFLSLAWLYKDDYASAGLHMLPERPASDGRAATQVLFNSAALLVVSCLPTFLGLTGIFYLITAASMGIAMTALSFGFFKRHDRPEARRVFLFSLLYIPVLVTLMLLNGSAT